MADYQIVKFLGIRDSQLNVWNANSFSCNSHENLGIYSMFVSTPVKVKGNIYIDVWLVENW